MRALLLPLRIFSYIFSLIPFSVIYLLSDLLYLVLYRISGYRKAVVGANLKRAFPDKTEPELEKIERDYYRNLCDIIVEFLKIPSLSESQLQKRFVFVNPEIPEKFSAENRSFISVSSHMCNWEWGALAISKRFSAFACLGVYKPLTNKLFDEWFRLLRSRFGMIMVPMKSTYRAIKTPYGKPVMLNLIADQTPTLAETEYEASFLGIPTPVFLGPEKIASSTGMPVIFFAVRRIKRGYYEAEAYPVSDSKNARTNIQNQPNAEVTSNTGHEITLAHLSILENEIRKNPGNWLWSHRRWKHSGKLALKNNQADKM